MRVIDSVARLRQELGPERTAGRVIGLVPTMGALHDGHLSLVEAARTRSDVVVVSIFVNPLQFGPGEDFESYPRDLEGDARSLEAAGVDIVFVPSQEEMYPPGRLTSVMVSAITDVLEGAHRPGHFEGVTTVVTKLFNIAGPDLAFFGQKDAQQVAVIKRMVEDLDLDVEIVVCPIVRERDGLAMSSRNAYLSATERSDARALYRALVAGRDAYGSGGPDAAETAMRGELEAIASVSVDYAVACDPADLGPPRSGRPVLLAVAARVGGTRLIDNMLLDEGAT